MKILLDTCTFLWMALDAHQLSSRARDVYLDPDNELFLSAVSVWEIALKRARGTLQLPGDVGPYVAARREMNGIDTLTLDEPSAAFAEKLPRLHGDPFDRMLICQAIVNGLTILTPDQAIRQYPVPTLW